VTARETHSCPGGDAPDPPPTSELLIETVARWTHDQMSVGDLIDGLGDRAFSIIFLLLVLPTAVPGPPGLPVVFGIPLLFVTAQLLLGKPRPWLPGIIRRRRFSRPALLQMLNRARPKLARLEAVCRPRLSRLSDRRGERWIAGFFFFCTLFLVNPIPVPFSHLPLAFAMTILALGFVERDGIVIIVGTIAALIGIVINVSLVGSAVMLGAKLFHSV
jgi:hypothetical protein